MSAMRKPKFVSLEEYFEHEKTAERKSEYFEGEVFAMAGACREHNELTRNLVYEFHDRLKDTTCRVYVGDLRVKIAKTRLFTYPDMLIVCDEPTYSKENADTLTNPTVLFEVLSESTETYDRTVKFRHYRTIDLLKDYVLVSQDEPFIERFTRKNGDWVHTQTAGLDATFKLETVRVKIPMADLYRGVVFPPPKAKAIRPPKS